MKKLIISALAILGVLAFASTNTQAVIVYAPTGTINSSVTIECPALVGTNGGTLAFGLIAAPTAGSDLWTLPATGGGLSHSGTGNGFEFPTPGASRGEFIIKGSEPVYFTVEVTTDFPTTELNLLSPLLLSGTSPIDPTPLPDDHNCAEVTVFVGGTLEVFPTAPTGAQVAIITITAHY